MLGKNGTRQIEVKEPRQTIAKRPLARELEEAGEMKEAKKMGKQVLAVGDPGEGKKRESKRGLGGAKKIKRLAAVVEDLKRGKKQGN